MATVTITFQGICTHFIQVPAPGGFLHRVVLVNASGENVIGGIRIPPHFAKMSVSELADHTPGTTFDLAGVALSIANVTGGVTYDPSYGQVVPSLSALMSGVATLPPPSSGLLLDFQYPAVAAYFDLPAGTFRACKLNGAAQVTVMVETSGDTVGINSSPFPNGGTGLPSVALASPASITVSNTGSLEAEMSPFARSHFLLHYLLAETFPPAAQIPLTIPDIFCPSPATVGAGCSDSNYP